MSKTIFKYPLTIDRLQIIQLPEGAKMLSVQLQHDRPTLWALVDSSLAPTPREIMMFGTGWEIDEGLELTFLGTVQHGSLVWHYFEPTETRG